MDHSYCVSNSNVTVEGSKDSLPKEDVLPNGNIVPTHDSAGSSQISSSRSCPINVNCKSASLFGVAVVTLLVIWGAICSISIVYSRTRSQGNRQVRLNENKSKHIN
jgi:hypothetical protein